MLRGKREKLGQIRQRPEAQRTGIYILLGEDPDNPSRKLAYIGQSDDVAGRLAQHHARKPFWDEVLIVTSKDQNLTTAHVRYLEARLTALAMQIGRVRLENLQNPTGGAALPEADALDMEDFIEYVRILFPVLGVDMFRGRSRPVRIAPVPAEPAAVQAPSAVTSEPSAVDPQDAADDDGVERSPVFHLRLQKRGADATAQVIDGEFTLLAGSVVAPEIVAGDSLAASTASQYRSRVEQRAQLVESGALGRDAEGRWVALRDIVFPSPSAAGSIVVGRPSINGRIAWRTDSATTYGGWEESRR
ncbi:GIY-YIG nuclease family protein [Brachybacterium sp. EF45031]|uniref:GIY-YIG nuclease family protein n=1 Tax=Brachybacterium sillae TaxID=2810536 RepID=UPI00217ED641|nr:GIY-YIG nuclease family protein [Brachybacterium sillae]MCS6712052.1 GIY-YIG nuclease family protein [Brachybacterium sillae]